MQYLIQIYDRGDGNHFIVHHFIAGQKKIAIFSIKPSKCKLIIICKIIKKSFRQTNL